MNKLLKEYKSLVIFVTIIVILLIVGVYKDKIIRQKIYENCIKYTDNYMEAAMKDFNDIYGGYTYLIKEDNKILDTLNFEFTDKTNDTLWLLDYEKLDNEIENLLEVEKRKHNPVSKAVDSLYHKYACPLMEMGYKIECRLLRNDYKKDGTISWMVSYKKKNLITSHFCRYDVKVNSDGSYQIIDTTEA